ncbi:MAG TPA: endonuclease/exonuclease/phosphatase family protein [Candidatus Saccharimonadia bacterium]
MKIVNVALRSRGLKILSYNLKVHEAYSELEALVAEHQPDLVCLQECYPERLAPRIGNLHLAGKTSTEKYGLAIYVRGDRFERLGSHSYGVARSVSELVRRNERDRLLVVELYDTINERTFYVASFHAIHLVATNWERRRQVRQALRILRQHCQDAPAVMAGDYNYPWFKWGLRRTVRRAGFEFLMSDKPTLKNRYFTGHFDMASTFNTHVTRVSTLKMGRSDHAPILLDVTL